MELYQRVAGPLGTFDREPRPDPLYDRARANYEARTRAMIASKGPAPRWNELSPGCHVDACPCPSCEGARLEADERPTFPIVELSAAYALEEMLNAQAHAIERWQTLDEIRVDTAIARYLEHSYWSARIEVDR